MTLLESSAPKWFIAVLLTHVALLVIGIAGQVWLLTAFCVWVRPQFVQTSLQIVWLLLTTSPVLGLAALRFQWLRNTYLVAAVTTPLFFVAVGLMNGAGILHCDAP